MAKQQKQTPPSTVAKPAAVSLEPNFIDKLGKNGIWLALLGIALIAFIVYKDFLLFKKVFLFKDIGSDTLNVFFPNIYYTNVYLHQYGLPSWSYNYGMGQNTNAFWLADLFNLLLYSCSKEKIASLIAYREVIKIACSGLLFYYFLKVLKLSNTTALFGGLIYSFTSFMILGGCWYFFSYDAFCIALILLAVELAISRANFFLVPLGIFCIAISQPFNLFLFSLFLFGYILLRFYFINEKVQMKSLFVFLVKLVIFGGVGLLLSGPFFFENIYQMLESPRGSGESSYAGTLKSFPLFGTADKWQFGTNVMRMFSSDILGSGNGFKGTNYNYLEAPMFYCGLPCLLLVPQVFGFLNKNAKRIFAGVLAFWVLPVIFPYFRYAIWLFAGDYYRGYSFMVSLVFMIFSVISLDLILKRRKINITVLIATLGGLLILSSINYFKDKDAVVSSVSLFVKSLLIGYAALLWFIPRVKNPANLIYIFFLCLVVELTFLSGLTVNNRDVVTTRDLKQKIGYNDFSNEAVKFIKERDTAPFYRIEKNYCSSPAMHGSINDGMVQDYYGTSCYNSFNNINYINYLHETGVINKTNEFQTRWASGLLKDMSNQPINRPILLSLNSVKYLVVKSINSPLWRASHDSIGQNGDVTVLKNKFVLPLGYAYKNYLLQSQFSKASVFQKDYLMLHSCFVADEDSDKLSGMKRFNAADTINPNQFTWELYRQRLDSLKQDTLKITQFSQTQLSGTIHPKSSSILYLSVPYDKGWQLTVNGEAKNIIKINGGMCGVNLAAGENKIEMLYTLPYFKKGLTAALAGIFIYLILFLFRKKISGIPS